MDNELIFRQAQSCETDRIMQIIRQAQARMHAAGSRQWQDGYPAPGHISADIGRNRGYVLCKPGVEGPLSVIAYGAVVFDGEPAYDAIDGQWLTDEPYVLVHRIAVADGERGPRRGGGIPAPCGDTRTGTRRQSLSHRHQLRQPDHAAAARTHGIHLLRESRLPERRTAGLRKTNLKTLRHKKTEPEAPLPGFFHFTVQRVTIFLKKSSRGTL